MIIGIASADRVAPNKVNDESERWGGSGWVRIGQYLPHLPFKVVVGSLVWKYDHLVIIDADQAEHHPDILVLQRLMHAGLADHIKLSRAYGQYIINDLDDWYWGLSTSNHAWKHSHPKNNPKENVNHYRSVLAASDMVTVSTSYLADRITNFVRCPITLLANTVDISRFPIKEHSDSEQPCIGWAGSTGHRSNDIETVASVLRLMHTQHGCPLLHVGDSPNHPRFSDLISLPREEVRTISLLPFDKYPSGLTMDIGIVPLNNVPFNRAKSDIKGLEYSAAGIPFVAQNLDSYEALHRTTGAGRLAKRPKDWLSHLKMLKDPHLRRDEGLHNKEAIQSRDISHGIKRWVDLLGSVLQ